MVSDLMDEYPDTFAVIQMHSSDGYETDWGDNRGDFYGVTAIPTFEYDGLFDAWPYTTYESKFLAEQAEPTDVTIQLSAGQVSGATFQITANVGIEAGGVGKTMRIYMVQVLDHRPESSSYARNCVMQGATSQDVTLTPGGSTLVQRTMTFDATSWGRPDDIRIVAWAQVPDSSGPAQVHQAAVLSWPFNALLFRLPEGTPEFVAPDASTNVAVEIQDAGESYVPGTGRLHYRYDGGAFHEVSLTQVEGQLFAATLPAPGCDGTPEYYFSAQGDLGTMVYEPAAAPDEVYTATVATVTTYLADNFESDLGWTVTSDPSVTDGAWERAVPSGDGSYGDPVVDFDGSGYCYVTTDGYHHDLDGGPTMLTSPAIDVSAANTALLRYARWMRCDDAGSPAEDFLDVELSDDDGATWVLVEHVPQTVGWVPVELNVTDYVSLTSQVRVRFTVSDYPNNSKTEAGVDALWLFELSCGPALCAGDMNCDGIVDYDDIDPFVAALSCVGGDPSCWDPACPWLNGDCNGDSTVSYADIDPFVGRIGQVCP